MVSPDDDHKLPLDLKLVQYLFELALQDFQRKMLGGNGIIFLGHLFDLFGLAQ